MREVVNGSVIVSWNFTDDDLEAGVLVVGEQQAGKPVEVVNAYAGEEAYKTFKMLTGQTIDAFEKEKV